MDQSEVTQLEALRSAIKREWETLLRAEPTLSPLGNPDTLLYMMDETLTQAFKGVASRSLKTWLRKSPALLAPLQRNCACGLNPLLNYYATGELALRAAAGKRLPFPTLEALLTSFHLKAQQEIDTLCAVCLNRNRTGCQSAVRPRRTNRPAKRVSLASSR